MTKTVGRNDLCPCGSRLKYKKCCLYRTTMRGMEDRKPHFFELRENEAMEPIPKYRNIVDENGSCFYTIFWDDTVERVNPIDYYKNYEIHRRAILSRDLLQVKEPTIASKLSYDFFVRTAQECIESERFWEIKEQTEVPQNFLKLFETTRKKDQETLLKGMSINPDQLLNLISKSYKDYGYLYSRYRFEHLPKGLDGRKKPLLADLSEEGVVKTVGKTDLTKGEIKTMIDHRKVIIAHFFDRDRDWHCLFTTYNSIDGRESWKDGQSHFHYISSAFGITRDEFKESLIAGKYKSTSIHIDLLGYGNQTK